MTQVKKIFDHPVTQGILLFIGAVLAVFLRNSAWQDVYQSFLSYTLGWSFLGLEKTALLWINDGLMAIFFLLVALEIKREFIIGDLSSRKKATLPLTAAIGGIVIPITLFWILTHDSPSYRSGWAIPAATDIAFGLAILSLMGRAVPNAARTILLAIAVIDDLAAISFIALFYTPHIQWIYLSYGFLVLLVLVLLNLKRVQRLDIYLILGAILWFFVLKSGVHATLAGVALGFTIPLTPLHSNQKSPLKKLEHSIHPVSMLVILPIFAFANAGVPLESFSWSALSHPLALGVALGLFLGKQIGVFGFMRLGLALNIVDLPRGVSLKKFYGIALLTGIGFTMSLFISGLAFDDLALQNNSRAGILVGSLLSAILGYCILRLSLRTSVDPTKT